MERPPAQRGIETRKDLTLCDYWHERVALHHEGRYAGLPMLKFPEDLRTYEELIWESRPEAIVELGSLGGGSALWFRDRMATLHSYGGPRPVVVSVDISTAEANANLRSVDPSFEETITLIEGDLTLPSTVEAVRRAVGGRSCLVIEDSAHTRETTAAALASFADLVPNEGFFVVEDGCVDVDWMRASDDWPRGVQPAVTEWLDGAGRNFVRRRDLEVYGFTCHPGGILQRRAEPPAPERQLSATPESTRAPV